MSEVFIWAAVYLTVMFLGYIFKRIGIFKAEDRKLLSNIILYITLPAMLVSSFTGVTVDFWYLIACALGTGLNALMILLARLASAKKTPELQAIYIINGAGLNLGNIGIPFLQNFFPSGIPYLCMFDVGDCVFTLGTTYAIAAIHLGKKSDSKLVSIFKSLLCSPPFITYLTMVILTATHITLPSFLLTLADFAGRGNGFLAMLMVGLSLELNLDKCSRGEVFRLLLLRYFSGVVIALFIMLFIPAPTIMKQILSVAVFAAAPNVGLIYTGRLGISTEIPSALNTISTLLMIPMMSLVMVLVQSAPC